MHYTMSDDCEAKISHSCISVSKIVLYGRIVQGERKEMEKDFKLV